MVVWSDAVLCEIMTKACHYMNQLLSTKCSEFLILICFPEICLDLGVHKLHEKYKLITDCPWATDKNKSLSNHRCPFKNTQLQAKLQLILTVLTWQQLKKMVQGLLKQLTANFAEVTLSTNTQKHKPLILLSQWYGTAYQSLFYFTSIYNTMKRPQRFNQILISSVK